VLQSSMAAQGARLDLGDARHASDWQQELGGSGTVQQQQQEEETDDSSHLYILVLIVAGCVALYYYYYMSNSSMNHHYPRQLLTEEERRQQREQMAMAAAARAKRNNDLQQEQQNTSPPKKIKRTVDADHASSSRVRATGEPEAHLEPTVDDDQKPAPPTISQQNQKEAAAPATVRPTAASHDEREHSTTGPLQDDHDPSSVDREAHAYLPTTATTESSSRHARNEESMPVETAAETETATAAAASVPKKPKRKKLVFPPPQILCEALSTVFKCQVTVESRVQDGTWGGEGWRKRPCLYSNTTTTVVTLTLPTPNTTFMGDNKNTNNDGDQEEWKALYQVFPAVLEASLSSSSSGSKLLRNDIRKAAQYHAEAKGVAKNGFTLLMKGEEGFQELKICMDIVCQWLVKQVETWIRPEVLRDMDSDDDDDDLFSRDYNTDPSPSAGAFDTGGKLDALFGLLEEAVPVVTSGFLEDLFRCHGKVGGEQGVPLCEYFYNKVLNRLAVVQNTKLFSCPTMTRRIFGVSNLLAASPSVCQYLAQSLKNEVGQTQGKNGKEIQELLRLAPLFEAVAYSVPAAGTEANPSSIPGGFLQQLELIESFPTSVFRSQKGDSTGQVMSESRRAIKAARTTAELVLRMAFKAGDKETVFDWLGSIASSK
jgi:hypothetical protein